MSLLYTWGFKSEKEEASWIIANRKRKSRKLLFDSKHSNEIISWASKTTTKKRQVERWNKKEKKSILSVANNNFLQTWSENCCTTTCIKFIVVLRGDNSSSYHDDVPVTDRKGQQKWVVVFTDFHLNGTIKSKQRIHSPHYQLYYTS